MAMTNGHQLLQSRPLRVSAAETQLRDEIWLVHPRLNGHPSGNRWERDAPAW